MTAFDPYGQPDLEAPKAPEPIAPQAEAPKRPKKKPAALIATIVAAVLLLGGGGIALGVNLAQSSAYDAAVREHNTALVALVEAQNTLPQAKILWVDAWTDNYASKTVTIGNAPETVIGTHEAAAVAAIAKQLAELEQGNPESSDLPLYEQRELDKSQLAKTLEEGGIKADRAKVEKVSEALKKKTAAVQLEIEAVEKEHDALDSALAEGAPALADAATSALKLNGALVEAAPKADATSLIEWTATLQKVLNDYQGDGAPAPESKSSLAVDPSIHTVKAAGLYDAQALALALDAYVRTAADFQQAHAEAVAAEQAATEAAASDSAGQWVDQGYNDGWGGGGSGGSGGSGGGSGGSGGWTPPYIPPSECEATNSCIKNNI